MADEDNQLKTFQPPPMRVIRDEGEIKRAAWISQETQRTAAWREIHTVDPKKFTPLQPK